MKLVDIWASVASLPAPGSHEMLIAPDLARMLGVDPAKSVFGGVHVRVSPFVPAGTAWRINTTSQILPAPEVDAAALRWFMDNMNNKRQMTFVNNKPARYMTFMTVLLAVRDVLPDVPPKLSARVADRCWETDEPVLDALKTILLAGVDRDGFRHGAKRGRGGRRKRARRNGRARS